MARREIDEKTKRRRPDIGDGRIYGNPVDAFLSTIEETIPQVLKASSLSTLSSSPCSPRGCTLSSVQLSFLPRGENDPSSPPPLPLHSRPCRGRISIGRKKSHLTIVKRGASLAARGTKSGGGKWEGGRETSDFYLFSLSTPCQFWYPVSARRPHLALLPNFAPFHTRPRRCRGTCLLTVSPLPLPPFFLLSLLYFRIPGVARQ